MLYVFLKFFSEPLLESLPQVFILFTMYAISTNIQPNLIQGSDLTLFYLTLSSSLISCSFGVAQFLKIGPCRLYEGYGIGFFIVMLSTLIMIFSKMLLSLMNDTSRDTLRFLLLILFTYMPQFLCVSVLQLHKAIFFSVYKTIQLLTFLLGICNIIFLNFFFFFNFFSQNCLKKGFL